MKASGFLTKNYTGNPVGFQGKRDLQTGLVKGGVNV
jgi:hypothetical protein